MITHRHALNDAMFFAARQALVYIDSHSVGQALVTDATPHAVIDQLCEAKHKPTDASLMSAGFGFRLALPPLTAGMHEVSVTCRSYGIFCLSCLAVLVKA